VALVGLESVEIGDSICDPLDPQEEAETCSTH
jgi:hypothetical protein